MSQGVSTGVDTEVGADARLPWELAMTLAERQSYGKPTEVDVPRGDKRIAMWLELPVFADTSKTTDEHLAPLDVTTAELAELLGETPRSIARRGFPEPDWHKTFVSWWQSGVGIRSTERRTHDDLGLLEVARPLIESAVRQLHQEIASRLASADRDEPVLAETGGLTASLQSTLPGAELLQQVQRTMVTELHVARLENRLSGATSEERYADFVSQLADAGTALSMWREYPVMARMVIQQLQFWLDATQELLNALMGDVTGLRERGLISAAATRLEGVQLGAGDKHRGGRSVAILRFDHGQLVFKPRALDMDTAFDCLLAWVNARDLRYPLRRTRMWDRGSHGWSEYIDAGAPIDASGADRYAWRLGALTALLYAMHATDFHYENIVAAGDAPVLVDLETLLHSDKRSAMAVLGGREKSIAAEILMNSVSTIGVLPNRFLVRDGDDTFEVDISGLGGRGGQKTPIALPTWDGDGTDAMRLFSRHMEIDAKANLPTDEQGNVWDLFGRSESFIEGFGDCYRLLAAGSTELRAPGGPLQNFAQSRSRLVLRATQVYGRVLMESTHPDFLRDGLDRDRSLARLLIGHRYSDCRESMIRSEIAEMHRGDVPVFSVDVASGVIRAGWRDTAIGAHTPAPLDVVTDRFGALNEKDRTTQEWIIRSSIAASTAVPADRQWPNWSRTRDEADVTADEATVEALRLAHRLDELAVRDGARVGWIGLGMLEDRFWRLSPADSDMYTGVAGIGLALDSVAAATGDSRSAALAQQVFDQLAREARWLAGEAARNPDKAGDITSGIGAFEILGGGIYTLSHAAARHQRHDLAEAAVGLLPVMELLIDGDDLLDVVSGAAGAVFALLAAHRVSPGSDALALAERCARRLIDCHVDTSSGWGWRTRLNPENPLAGFSHGASGVAVALARLNQLAPKDEYTTAIRQAVRYEASLYDPRSAAWPDLRPAEVSGAQSMSTWCHGGPGIALARHELLRLDAVPDMAEELNRDRRRGVRSVLATGLDQPVVSGVGNHCLCHGDVGNLLIAQKCHRADEDHAIAELLPKVWRTLIGEGRTHRWLCGVPDGIETPDLMTGIAGIAWGLVRLARPDLVPDLLALEPPRTGLLEA